MRSVVSNTFVGTATKPVPSTGVMWSIRAHPATIGYNFATGIGTINAANLVNKWATWLYSGVHS
jgi:subtilase family serine protease